MRKLARFVERISDIISGHFPGWLIILMMGLVLIEVISRYAVRAPLRVSDEYSAYLYVVAVFMGAAYTWKEKGHVRIEILVSRLSTRAAQWLRLVTIIGAVIFIPVLIKASFDLFTYSFDFHIRAQSWMRTPLAPIQLFMFIGLVFLFAQLIVELIKAIQALRAGQGETR